MLPCKFSLHSIRKITLLICINLCFFAVGFSNTTLSAFDYNHTTNTDLTLTAINCDNNILTNPDFENQNISGWEGAGQYAETGTERYLSVCDNYSNARQTKAATVGTTYNLSVRARRSSLTSGNIRMKFLSSSWQPILEEFGSIVGGGDFQNVSISATAPDGTAYIEISAIKRSGSGCVDVDDWCLTTGGGGGNGPDLNLARLTGLANNADPGEVVYFNFDLINSGDEAVSRNYSIGAYLSNDAHLSIDDVRVGEVNTGNTAVGTIPNVQGAITIPSNQATGNYFLILKADDGDDISESNESNNLLSGNIFINDIGGGDGPTVTLTTASTTVDGPFTVSVQFSESVTDFTLAEIEVTNGTKSNPAQQSGSSYSFTITPINQGEVTVLVLANSAFNSEGEGNEESNLLSVTFGDGDDRPDLFVFDVRLSNYTAIPGDDVGVLYSTNNLGGPDIDLDITGGYDVRIYLSDDQVLSSDDINLGGTILRSFGDGFGQSINIPDDTADGQYYVIVQLDPDDEIEEQNENNNIAIADRPITIGDIDNEGVDLELAAITTNNNPKVYEFFTTTFTLINNGDATASDIRVRWVNQGDGFVPRGGMEADVSQGSANPVIRIWEVGTLAAGASASIDLNYFNLDENPKIVWAEVQSQSPNDADSQAGNGTAPAVNEDDETAININSDGGDGLVVDCPDDVIADYSDCYRRDPRGPNLPIESTAIPVPTASSDCSDGGVTVELVPNPDVREPGGFFNFYYIIGAGNYTVEWKITDACGSEEICAYDVTIISRPSPITTVDCPENIIIEVAEGVGGAVVNYNDPVINQNCCNPNEGFIELIEGLESGSFFPVGTTTQLFSGFVDCTQRSVGCSFTVTVNEVVDPGGDECGFDRNYNVTTTIPEKEVRAFESADGYGVLRYSESQFSISLIRYIIDFNGDPINVSANEYENGEISFDGTSLYDIEFVSGLDYELRSYNFDGSNPVSYPFSLLPPSPAGDFSVTSINVLEGADFYVVFAILIDNTNGRQYPNIIKIGKTGSIIDRVLLDEVENFTLGKVALIGQDGGVYIRYDLPGRVGNITKYDTNGNFVAAMASQGDLVSSRLFDPVESPDGQFIYVPLYSDPLPVLGKYDADTGAEIYRLNLSNILSPDIFSAFGRNTSVLPLENGEALVGYNFNDFTVSPNRQGYEYGKLDAAGNLIWRQELPDSYNLRPLLATTDGGYLFFGENTAVVSGGTPTIVKTTSQGLLTPDCNPILENTIDLELSLSANPANPGIYGNVGITATIVNNGTEPANDVNILLSGCNESNGNYNTALFYQQYGVVYATPEYNATKGIYQTVSQLWTIPTLAAGESATLDITLFTLTNEPRDILGFVSSAVGEDVDSSPGFSIFDNACQPQEDDEAAITINANSAAQNRSSIEQEYSINQILDYKIHKTFPTLTENEVTVLLFSKRQTQMDMVIYDLQGRKVQQQKIDIIKGPNQIRIEVNKLTSGVHNIMFTPQEGLRGKPLVTRFVKQRL